MRGAYGSVKYIANPRRKEYRLAVVVSRKVHKSAVVRNRIRRRLYEAVRMVEADFTGAYDIVFTVYSEQIAALPAQELRERVSAKLLEAGILSNNTHADSGHDIVKAKEL